MKIELLSYLEGDIVNGDYGFEITVLFNDLFYKIQKNLETNVLKVLITKHTEKNSSVDDCSGERKTELLSFAKTILTQK